MLTFWSRLGLVLSPHRDMVIFFALCSHLVFCGRPLPSQGLLFIRLVPPGCFHCFSFYFPLLFHQISKSPSADLRIKFKSQERKSLCVTGRDQWRGLGHRGEWGWSIDLSKVHGTHDDEIHRFTQCICVERDWGCFLRPPLGVAGEGPLPVGL